jgi:hypothetical protein
MSRLPHQHIKTMFDQLRAAGATEVVISFDGSGDSGSIEYVSIHNADRQQIQVDQTVIYPKEKSTWIDGQWVNEIEHKEIPILEALEAYCYDELEKTNIDWYNNEGGFGDMRIILSDTVLVELEVNERYTEYQTTTFNLSEELEEN